MMNHALIDVLRLLLVLIIAKRIMRPLRVVQSAEETRGWTPMCSHLFFDFIGRNASERDRAVRRGRPKAKLTQLDVEALLECLGGTPVHLLQVTILHEPRELVVDVRADPVVEARMILQANGDELDRAGLGPPSL